MPRYADVSTYEELRVPFYKRAQITCADLALAFDGRGPGAFRDLGELTLFADNLVPHVLRMKGVLRYAPELAARIDAEELLESGGREEVEIRAVAREVGGRTKLAVSSRDESIDPVGACVGLKGSRVRAVVQELGGERIDIVPWHPDPEVFAKRSLAPAPEASGSGLPWPPDGAAASGRGEAPSTSAPPMGDDPRPTEAVSLATASFEDLRALGMSKTQAIRTLRARDNGTLRSMADFDDIPGFQRHFREELRRRLVD